MSTGLTSYSIEGDAIIFLQFQDGRKLRVEIDDLPTLVSVDDLTRIHEALKLRTAYIDKHLPTWIKVVALVVVISFMAAQTTKAAQVIQRLWHPVKPTPQVQTTAPATNTPLASPTVIPSTPAKDTVPTASPHSANYVAPAQTSPTRAITPNQAPSLAAPIVNAVAPIVTPVTEPVQGLLKPITQKVPKQLQPLTKPLGL